MKLKTFTRGLIALGVISAALHAGRGRVLNTSAHRLVSTTISGYVDTSAQWNLGTGNGNNPSYTFGGSSKADGFNLDVVQISIAKPLMNVNGRLGTKRTCGSGRTPIRWARFQWYQRRFCHPAGLRGVARPDRERLGFQGRCI